VAAASVKTEAMDYMKPVRPALYTEKKVLPTEVHCGIIFNSEKMWCHPVHDGTKCTVPQSCEGLDGLWTWLASLTSW